MTVRIVKASEVKITVDGEPVDYAAAEGLTVFYCATCPETFCVFGGETRVDGADEHADRVCEACGEILAVFQLR